MSRRQCVSSLTTYFGDKLFLLYFEGCGNVVGFKASLGQLITIAKKNNSNSDDDDLEKLVMNIDLQRDQGDTLAWGLPSQ